MLQEMVRRDPGNAQAHLSYNRLLHGEKKEKKFLSSFDGAPQTTDLQLSKASLLVTAGRDEEAQEIYARLLAAEPDNVMAANGLAEGLSKLGRSGGWSGKGAGPPARQPRAGERHRRCGAARSRSAKGGGDGAKGSGPRPA